MRSIKIAAAVSALFFWVGATTAQGQEKTLPSIVKINTPKLVCYPPLDKPDKPDEPKQKLERYDKKSVPLPLATVRVYPQGYYEVVWPLPDKRCWIRAGQVETDQAKNVNSTCPPVRIAQAAHAGTRGVGESCN